MVHCPWYGLHFTIQGKQVASPARRRGPAGEAQAVLACQGVMFDHSSAGTKRARWAGLPVATTTAVFNVSACAARITSPSRAGSGAVGWPVFRASAHSSAARRITVVVRG